MGIKKLLKQGRYKSDLNFFLYQVMVFFLFKLPSEKFIISKKFKMAHGYDLNLDNLQTLNEKIQWLKLHDRKDIYTIMADKYEVRNYLADKFGKEYLIPLIFHTDNWREITPDNIKEYPCIVKANHTSGDYVILRDPNSINWDELRRTCKFWLKKDYYVESQEWQYKNIHRQIVVEKLLQTEQGKIPNDYKLHYINGELQFVYCSIDREGVDKRNIYDKDWNPLPFSWVSKATSENVRGEEIEAPKTFDLMKRIGDEVASDMKYVRVDFYDVDGKLYFGEITLYHGSGYDIFVPQKYDKIYGDKLKLQ